MVTIRGDACGKPSSQKYPREVEYFFTTPQKSLRCGEVEYDDDSKDDDNPYITPK